MSEENDFSKTGYFLDAENAAEMARLINQDRILTRCMGGLFPPQLDLTNTHDILDIACGPGSWALDVARTYPDTRVTAIDISQIMTEFARFQSREQDLPNAHFIVMDALKPLDFPDNSFDFVNARFIGGFLSRAAWPHLLHECQRITRPGGITRLTEFESPISNSFAVATLCEMFARAMYKAGQSFAPTGGQVAITPLLERFLRDAGYEHIQQMPHVLNASAGTPEHHAQYQNLMVSMKLGQPYLIKIGIATQQEAESLYQRALEEMMSPEYGIIWYFLSAWGEKPRS